MGGILIFFLVFFLYSFDFSTAKNRLHSSVSWNAPRNEWQKPQMGAASLLLVDFQYVSRNMVDFALQNHTFQQQQKKLKKNVTTNI